MYQLVGMYSYILVVSEPAPKWLERVEVVVYDFRDSHPLFNYGAKFFHLRGFFFSDYFGPDCTRLGQIITVWSKVVLFCPDWTSLVQYGLIGPAWSNFFCIRLKLYEGNRQARFIHNYYGMFSVPFRFLSLTLIVLKFPYVLAKRYLYWHTPKIKIAKIWITFSCKNQKIKN